MKEMETEHGVLFNCNDNGIQNKKIVSSFFDWWVRKRCVQYIDLGEEKKC